MPSSILLKTLAFLSLTAFGWPNTANAQEFPPKKTITIVVGFAPGGSADNAARVIAKKLSEDLGQNVIVDNKPGAGGNIASAQVKRAAPDGRTLYVTHNHSGTVVSLDVESDSITHTVTTGVEPRSMAISSDGTALYVVNYESNSVAKVRTSDLAVTQTVPTGVHPKCDAGSISAFAPAGRPERASRPCAPSARPTEQERVQRDQSFEVVDVARQVRHLHQRNTLGKSLHEAFDPERVAELTSESTNKAGKAVVRKIGAKTAASIVASAEEANISVLQLCVSAWQIASSAMLRIARRGIPAEAVSSTLIDPSIGRAIYGRAPYIPSELGAVLPLLFFMLRAGGAPL